jgi:nucleotide-binding universal stress UspA family protein
LQKYSRIHQGSTVGKRSLAWELETKSESQAMKKVLLATDGSSYADDAARLLALLPHNENVDVVVLSVLNLPATNRTSVSREWIDQCVNQENERASETFANIQSMFEGANATLRHVIEEGHVGSTIVNIGSKEDVDLIVIGARGHSQISRILLGSVSDHVATHAASSVLVVRPTGLGESDRSIRIAVAFEDTPAAQHGIDEICEINWGANPDIQVITVAPATLPYSEDSLRHDEQAVQSAAEKLSSVAAHTKSHMIENDHVGEGLVNYTEQSKCDIMVVSDSNRGLLGRMFLGSVSRYVLRHASCSVWITRGDA